MTRHVETRILAVDARRNRFGYVLFEGPERLLDWGGSEISPGLNDRAAVGRARKRIRSVLRLRHPMVVVLKRPRRMITDKISARGPVLKAIVSEATGLQIPTHFVSRKDIREAFRILPGHSKYDIANRLVQLFPELVTRLPPRRKAWQSEPRSMIVFDAIAAGFAYWQRNGKQLAPPDARIP